MITVCFVAMPVMKKPAGRQKAVGDKVIPFACNNITFDRSVPEQDRHDGAFSCKILVRSQRCLDCSGANAERRGV